MEHYYISHWGIKDQKWGIRRFQNYDGTLTPEGRKRYSKKGLKEIQKAEKERKRRQKILSDPSSLYKHRHEFTTAELEAARNRFDVQEKIREQARKEKLEKLDTKLSVKRAKAETESAIKKTKAESALSEQKLEAAKAEEKRKKEQAKADEARKKREEERKVEQEQKKEEKEKWPNRAKKIAGIFATAVTTKSIFDELGVTDPKSGKSLFGSLGNALGWKNKPAAEAAEEVKAAETEEKKRTRYRVKKTVSDAKAEGKNEITISELVDKMDETFEPSTEELPKAKGKKVDATAPWEKGKGKRTYSEDEFIDIVADWAKETYSNVSASEAEQAATQLWLKRRS